MPRALYTSCQYLGLALDSTATQRVVKVEWKP